MSSNLKDRFMPHDESDAELGIERVPWDSDDPNKSLLGLYVHDTNFARVKVRWYLNDADKWGKRARRIRLVAIMLGTVGVVMPLIDAALAPSKVRIGAWGYVVLAVAAGLFSIDRFGGYSWRWTRSTIIWVALRRELAEFQHDWNMLMSQSDCLVKERLARLKVFRQKVEAIISQECKDWADMTLQARIELEQALKRDLDSHA
jgi:hypothetical protein